MPQHAFLPKAEAPEQGDGQAIVLQHQARNLDGFRGSEQAFAGQRKAFGRAAPLAPDKTAAEQQVRDRQSRRRLFEQHHFPDLPISAYAEGPLIPPAAVFDKCPDIGRGEVVGYLIPTTYEPFPGQGPGPGGKGLDQRDLAHSRKYGSTTRFVGSSVCVWLALATVAPEPLATVAVPETG
jgi:hypothetical protein